MWMCSEGLNLKYRVFYFIAGLYAVGRTKFLLYHQ